MSFDECRIPEFEQEELSRLSQQFSELSSNQPTHGSENDEFGKLVGVIEALLSHSIIPDGFKPCISKVEQKPFSWKMGLAIGEFDQPQCAVHLRYKEGGEASSLAYDYEIESDVVAVAFTLRAEDDADSFQLGELSACLKGMIDPALESFAQGKVSFSTKLTSEFDGTKLLKLQFEIKHPNLRESLHKLMTYIEPSKIDLDIEFAERPIKDKAAADFLFARLRLEAEFKRAMAVVSAGPLREWLGKFPRLIDRDLSTILTLVKSLDLELEFDSFTEFWETLIIQPSGESPKWSWNLCADPIISELKKKPPPAEIKGVMKELGRFKPLLAGIHSIHFLIGQQNAFEIKAEHLDLFKLLPTLEELEESWASYVRPHVPYGEDIYEPLGLSAAEVARIEESFQAIPQECVYYDSLN